MRDALKSYLALAGGVTEVTRQKALDTAKALVAQGEAAAEQVTTLAEDLLVQTRQNREAVVALVGFEVDRALGRVGLASADEVTALTERVRSLEAELAASTAAPVTAAPAGEAPGKKAPAGAAPGKKTPGKKTPGKKAPAKKAPAGEAPAKKAAADSSAPRPATPSSGT